jgi:hypothetical protein
MLEVIYEMTSKHGLEQAVRRRKPLEAKPKPRFWFERSFINPPKGIYEMHSGSHL